MCLLFPGLQLLCQSLGVYYLKGCYSQKHSHLSGRLSVIPNLTIFLSMSLCIFEGKKGGNFMLLKFYFSFLNCKFLEELKFCMHSWSLM